MGIDWPQVQAANPRAILVSATTFGAGPNGDRLGFDGIAQVMSGAVHLSGVAGQPTKAYVPWVDFGTAHLLAFAAMAALLARERTGVGQHVDGALMKTALTVANSPIIEQAVLGLDRVATLNRGQTSGPYDIFDTADGHVIVMVIGGRQFDRWCRIVGADDLRRRPAVRRRPGPRASMARRSASGCRPGAPGARRPRCWPRSRPPASRPARSTRRQEALDDASIAGFLEPLDYPGAPATPRVGGFPVDLSATPGRIHGRAPLLGEHTDAVLGELGYPADRIAALRAAGTV